ncbi:MAG TPA: hypothetical protein VFY05_10730 [Candidatus Angelobacter sp.]|nr:hypothetical protein [Candidatus Angelobacter sp.]
MRSVRILVLGVLGLAAALLFPLVQSYLLFTLAAAPLALLAFGQFYLPRSKRTIQVWFPPILDDDGEFFDPEPGAPFLRLSGKYLTYSFFKQWHEFEIVTHRFWLLLAIGLISLIAIWLVWRTRDNFLSGATFFYLVGSAWTLIVALAIRWGWERRMLRREGVAMAGFSIGRSTRLLQHIRYHFIDNEGHYWGGVFDSMFCNREDDLTLVFYDEVSPEHSIPASALIFHKVVWKVTTPENSAAVASR